MKLYQKFKYSSHHSLGSEAKKSKAEKNIWKRHLIKDLNPQLYKEYLKVKNKETEIWFKNRPKILTDTSSKMIYTWQISTWKYVPYYIS